jgi:RNA polymerase sigma-70 factor (ECF subfamily)
MATDMTADPDTEQLVERASAGDETARQALLFRHRDRLRRMVAVRLDRRLAARVDPSDVVQEALADAARLLSQYLQDRPEAFYPWIRRLAWEPLVKLNRMHVEAGKRSVRREADWQPRDESAAALAAVALAPNTSPSNQAVRRELCERVADALDRLGERDREVLVLRYLEQLSTADVAAVLNTTVGAVKVRHLRALERLRTLLSSEDRP